LDREGGGADELVVPGGCGPLGCGPPAVLLSVERGQPVVVRDATRESAVSEREPRLRAAARGDGVRGFR